MIAREKCRRYAYFSRTTRQKFHEIWHENTLRNKELEDYKKNWTLTKEIQDILMNLQRGIIKDLYI